MRSKIKIISLSLAIFLMGLAGCEEDWLTENPLSELSEAAFWQNESDAKLALIALYQSSRNTDGYSQARAFSWNTDEGRFKVGLGTWTAGQFYETFDGVVVRSLWNAAYILIYRCNLFLENIDKVPMDAALKAQYIAEARFFRAEQYFWLSFRYGDVPLITKVLTLQEANSQTRTPRQQVVDYALSELTAAAADLPLTRPADEKGRILKGAALAYKGRLLMIEKRWTEAAAAFKEIIDSGAHIIDDRFQDLWTVRGNDSKEIIYTKVCLEGTNFDNRFYQRNFIPEIFGGYQEHNAYQETVDAFLMNDGLPIEDSPLYDPDKPFDNRDPRLYASIFLPEYSMFRGQIYLAHPENTRFGIRSLIGATGYHVRKFVDEQHLLPVWTGADYVYIRYAEVLLGYLESMLESGATITQTLLDNTINKLRTRAAINMPLVTETNTAQLREIVRRERRTELYLEPFIRHMDVLRWGLWPAMMETSFHGMKLTDDPANYTAYLVNNNGHLISWDRRGHFREANKLLPIPQAEIDVNPDLGQNTGY